MTKSISYQVRHQTVYAYAGTVAHAHHLLHLAPRLTDTQICHEHKLDIWPRAVMLNNRTDAFGNLSTRLEIDQPHDRLEVTARMNVELLPRPQLRPEDSLPWEQVSDGLSYRADQTYPDWLEAARFRSQSDYVPIKGVFKLYAADCFTAGKPVLAGALDLMHKIHAEFAYVKGETDVGTSLLEVLTSRRGVCQDYAHFMIACLRALGLSARYVSGYLHTRSSNTGEQVQGAEASHAWIAVFVPPLGWVELDPTNRLVVNQDHVVLAWGRDFGDVSPLRGVILGGGAHSLEVGVAVQALQS
jgi:transglutaminase-like putative cysteine protease